MKPNLTITTALKQEIKCDSCHRLKIHCDRADTMCSGCFQRGVLCTYSTNDKPSLARNLSLDTNMYRNKPNVNRNLSVDQVSQSYKLNPNLNINTMASNNQLINVPSRNLSIDSIQMNNGFLNHDTLRGNSYPPPNLNLSNFIPNISINRSASPLNLSDINPSFTSSPIYQSPTGTSPSSSLFRDGIPNQEMNFNLPKESSPIPIFPNQFQNNMNQTTYSNTLLSPITNSNFFNNGNNTNNMCHSPNSINTPTIILEPPQANSLPNNLSNTNVLSSSPIDIQFGLEHLSINNANFIFPENMIKLPSEAIMAISYYFRNLHPIFPVVDPFILQKKLSEQQMTTSTAGLIEAIVSISKLYVKNSNQLRNSITLFLTQINLESYFPNDFNAQINEDKLITTSTYLLDQLHSFHFANSLEF